MAQNKAGGKFYAVRVGRVPGVYQTWDEAKEQVDKFPGAEHCRCNSMEDALEFVNGSSTPHKLKQAGKQAAPPTPSVPHREGKHADVFTDGSYNKDTQDCGYGIYIDDGEKKQIIVGRFKSRHNGWNAEGEVAGAETALSALIDAGYTSITLYHDHMGVKNWADGTNKANKPYTQAYAEHVRLYREQGIDIQYVHAKGHTGIEGNEFVDKLAKAACGAHLSETDKRFLAQLRDVPGYPVDAIELQILPEEDATPTNDMELG